MKKILFALITWIVMAVVCSCSVTYQVPWQAKVIPGHYQYVHSWTYPSPEGGYMITCSEEGTLDFEPNGRFIDRAVQYHTAHMAGEPCWTFDYECHGLWRVQDGHFLFCEFQQDFVMELMGVNIDYTYDLEWAARLANRMVQNSMPKSSRWITFDIVTLNEHEFTWSYTYPDGHTDYWEMHRVE